MTTQQPRNRGISRDRRKEFNENAEPLLEYYDELYIELTEPGYMSTTKFPIHSLGKIARRLSPYKRRKFMALIKEIISLKTNTCNHSQHDLIKSVREVRKIIRLR